MPVPVFADIMRDDDVSGDPLAVAMAPPNDESPQERTARLKREASAKLISDAIDEDINRSRHQRRKRLVKVLLLGQSESGKSTALKNFQIAHTPKEFREERSSWRSVIFLNIVRSIRLVLEAVTEAQDSNRGSPQPRHRLTTSGSNHSLQTNHSIGNLSSRVPPTSPSQLTQQHLQLVEKLKRLEVSESKLVARLAAKGETEATSVSGVNQGEVSVHATSRWKDTFTLLRRETLISDTESAAEREREEAYRAEQIEEDEIAATLRETRPDVEELWNDGIIRGLHAVQRLRLEELPGFFLNDLRRVTAPGYIPSDDDVLKARLKTLGVTEYKIVNHSKHPFFPEWRIFDVGGTRSQREYWVPYFDDMDAIIFLAPISCFDQTLVEDSNVNRLKDSFDLWKALSKNRLLAKCHIVLFLNKCDILQKKLESGIRFSKYIKTYGENKPNELEATRAYLRRKFEDIQREVSPSARPFYCHYTSLVDTRKTLAILNSVEDMIMRQNLQQASLV